MESQNKIPRKSKAVSPVIATVILVAVAITVAVAVSYWMSGIAGQYTSFEKVEIQTAICTYQSGGAVDYWQIVITMKNSGTKAASLTNVFVNDVQTNYTLVAPVADTGISAELDLTGLAGEPLHVESGVSVIVTVYIVDGATVTLTAGTTTNIKIHSAGGMDYIKLVQLV